MSEENNIELRSEEFQEILGSVPPWILRWGITTLAGIVVILLAGSVFFKYPDVLSSQIVLTGSTPPAVIVAKASGKLKELYVSDNQEVKTGEYLAVIENPAKTEDVLFLKNNINSDSLSIIKQRSALANCQLSIPPSLRLGALQSSYSAFQTALHEYQEYKRLLYYPQKIAHTKERIKSYENQYKILQNQQKLTQEQLNLAQSKYQRDSLLNSRGVLSAEEFENSRNTYLSSLMTVENITSSLNSMQIQIGQLGESLYFPDANAGKWNGLLFSKNNIKRWFNNHLQKRTSLSLRHAGAGRYYNRRPFAFGKISVAN